MTPVCFELVGLKGRSEKSPVFRPGMKAEPLRHYDKYIYFLGVIKLYTQHEV